MDGIDQNTNAASTNIGQELNAVVERSGTISHQMCEYALENILLHQAAAQQMQGTTSSLVHTGQQLLATSRQIAPQLEQLAAMAQSAKQLRCQAEGLQQLTAMLKVQPPVAADASNKQS
eukprot:gene7757-7956_t